MKKYILYGAGWQAEKFLYTFHEKESIAYCIDKFRTGTFHGIPIYTLDQAPDLLRYKIIVVATWDNYEQIRIDLVNKGLTEFLDFIWHEALGKKIAVINANCHGEFYKRYLGQSNLFTKEYIIWYTPALHLRKTDSIPEQLLMVCDLFIHQDIRPQNKFGYKFSDEYILPRLKDGCRTITVPNLVGMGKWNFPTAIEKEYRYGTRAMFCRDSVLDTAYQQNKSIVGIKEYITSPDVFPAEKVKRLFEECIAKLKEREKNWDIKISDYILEHYKTEKLFYDYDHAADGVMQEIGKRLCKLLKITDIKQKLKYPLNWEESFTFPYVKAALGIKYEETYIRDQGTVDIILNSKKMDLEEYIREYIWWFYGDYIE